MPYFLTFLGTVVIVLAIVLLIRLFEELEDLDGLAISVTTLLLIALFTLGIVLEIAGIDHAGSKIKTKEIIVPDTLVFTKNGVSDTTYVYNRPIIENNKKECLQ